ncbi:hypothetical protein BJ322DRAFT_631451 [Thelephora terrestris]|uniref:Uncharacterized protein n=1 Tax=Thelephora terrestris TaxID=56493 RepID=A0A9P6HJW7_9AGAM|nr:hypothetical protein BJ322DRAFT_631451 [Thelephora terrestris]
MTILQDLRPITRANMAQLSLEDIRAYAKAYHVPSDVIEHGTVDELLDSIFRLRPPHPDEYPINTPHLFTHKIVRTQEDRDKEFLSHKPYTGFGYRQNLAKFRRTKSRVGRPAPPEHDNQTVEVAEEQHRSGAAEGEDRGNSAAQPEDRPVDQPVASSSITPTNRQPNVLAEGPPGRLSPVSTPSQPTVPNEGTSRAPATTIPTNDDPLPSLPEKSAFSNIPAPKKGGTNNGPRKKQDKFLEGVRMMTRGNRPPPVPPPLGFEVADDLSNLKSALEDHEEAMASRPRPTRIIVDDELFGLEFTPDMTQAGKEAIVRERYAIATSNHMMIEQMLAEAEAEANQALWQLTALQPRLDATQEHLQKFVNEFWASTNRRGSHLTRRALSDAENLARDAWELDWNEKWVYTEDDEKEEERMKEIAQARAAKARVTPSHSVPIPQR